MMSTEGLYAPTGVRAVGRCLCRGVLHNRQAVLRIRTGSVKGFAEPATRQHSSRHTARQQAGPCPSPRGESSSSIMPCIRCI